MKLPVSFCAILFTLSTVAATAPEVHPGEDHPSINYPTDLAPSAQLNYKVKADRNIISLNGEAIVNWKITYSKSKEKDSKPIQTYSVTSETRAPLFGKILETKSDGLIDSFGLAPNQYQEHRLNKKGVQTNFDREALLIKFSESSETYPIKGGEQDRSSAVWQLVSVARASPKKFITPNSKWVFFVAGRRDAEKWTFSVDKKEQVSLPAPFGKIDAVHIIKEPPPDSKEQRLDIWLAPGLEWYPVRIKFSDADGNMVDQNLDSIKKPGSKASVDGQDNESGPKVSNE